jgi:hypothetical protein
MSGEDNLGYENIWAALLNLTNDIPEKELEG